MARSTIDALPDPIRVAALDAMRRGETIDAIVDLIQAMGGEASRSAVGRYSKNFAALAKRQRDISTVAESFGREFGGADDKQGRLMVQLVTSVVTRSLLSHATAEEGEEEVPALELARLAKAAKDAMGAAKLDIEREAKIREEERKRAKLDAAAAAVEGGRAAGATPETIEAIRTRILGMA